MRTIGELRPCVWSSSTLTSEQLPSQLCTLFISLAAVNSSAPCDSPNSCLHSFGELMIRSKGYLTHNPLYQVNRITVATTRGRGSCILWVTWPPEFMSLWMLRVMYLDSESRFYMDFWQRAIMSQLDFIWSQISNTDHNKLYHTENIHNDKLLVHCWLSSGAILGTFLVHYLMKLFYILCDVLAISHVTFEVTKVMFSKIK